MNSKIFAYLRRKHLSDTQTINRLFVSAFVTSWNLQVENNQLIKDLLICESDEEYFILQDFLKIINKYHSGKITIEDLVRLFEFVISPSDRIVSGAIYTPHCVRTTIIRRCLESIPNNDMTTLRVADIACGCGGFLIDVAEILRNRTGLSFLYIFKNLIYGIDIQEYSVERTKILLILLALINGEDNNFDFNIYHADTLEFNMSEWNQKYNHFDVIVGNPPYVCSRNVDNSTKEKMKKYEVCKSGHPDLYIPFFQIATEMLKDGGKLGLITMNSFIRSVNGRATRGYFSKGVHDISIIDFRGYQIFKKKNTYTCLFYLTKNQESESLHYAVNESGDLSIIPVYSDIPFNLLDDKKGWSLNDFENVHRIETSGIPIGKYCQSRHGIATLNNKTYIFKPAAEDDTYFYLDIEGKRFAIEKSICKNIVNSNKLNSEVSFENIIEKVIFPYETINGKVQIINEATLKSIYPSTYEYLKFRKLYLENRDKGNTNNYPEWYAFGRTQSLTMPRYKLFFPKFANKPLHCLIVDDKDLLLYNGIAFVSDSLEKLIILKNVLDSNEFWDYIVKNAKPYSSGYYSLSGVDIKNYCIDP